MAIARELAALRPTPYSTCSSLWRLRSAASSTVGLPGCFSRWSHP